MVLISLNNLAGRRETGGGGGGRGDILQRTHDCVDYTLQIES